MRMTPDLLPGLVVPTQLNHICLGVVLSPCGAPSLYEVKFYKINLNTKRSGIRNVPTY